MLSFVNFGTVLYNNNRSTLKKCSTFTPNQNYFHSKCSLNFYNKIYNKLDEEYYAKEGLKKELMPKHVAIMIDGSRRWHKAQGKPLSYEPFFEANTLFADLCLKWGITTATSFIYSLNNLKRDRETNDIMFGQLERYLEDKMEDFIRKEIRVTMIGERHALSKSLHDKIKQAEEETRKKDRKQLEFMLAICYSGRRDIVQATRNICDKAINGVIEPSAIDESLLNQELWTHGAPHPDLLIRTSGRFRVSDYMMWQLAYSEFYFTDVYFPEFQEAEFLEALRTFQQRDRTFGK